MRAAEAGEPDRRRYLDLSAGFDRQTQGNLPTSPLPPSPEARQEELASRTASDLKQVQTSFTVFEPRLEADSPRAEDPRAAARGEEQTAEPAAPGQAPTEGAFLAAAGDKAG